MAVTDLESFLVPRHHFQLLLQSFDISVDIGDLDHRTSNNQPACQVERRMVSLLYQLVFDVESVGKRLVDVSWEDAWVEHVEKRCY